MGCGPASARREHGGGVTEVDVGVAPGCGASFDSDATNIILLYLGWASLVVVTKTQFTAVRLLL